MKTEYDVIVLGAGPAGATVAGLIKKYRPDTRVVLVERETFPRHRLGESLLIDGNRILHDLGVLDRVDAAGFSRKFGSTFRWGPKRDPWTLEWAQIPHIQQIKKCQMQHTWHVDRAEFDGLLLAHAQELGVEVIQPASARRVLRDGTRVTGVTILCDDGIERDINARFVVDAAGKSGPVYRECVDATVDDKLRNLAVYRYYRGVNYIEPVFGTGDSRRTGILMHPQGWVWLIPMAGGRTSVGFVTSLANFQSQRPPDLDQFLEDRLRELPEFGEVLQDAEVCDYPQFGTKARTVQEYSVRVGQVSGPGWAVVGDSAGFVDAILSVGVFLAQSHAQLLAYALNSALDGTIEEELAMASYNTVVRENVDGLRAITHLFYAFSSSEDEWWQSCSSVLRRSSLVPDASATDAFVSLISGLAARNHLYEEALHLIGGDLVVQAGRGGLLPSDTGFPTERLDATFDRIEAKLHDRAERVSLSNGVDVRPFALPHTGHGRLRPVLRAQFAGLATGRVYLSESLGEWLAGIDGTRSARSLVDTLPSEKHDEAWSVLMNLAGMGALRFGSDLAESGSVE